jgi:NAD(P)-dependent dehydrogenase (short-subunit alcohol dehydrogenase family)
MSGRRAIVTGCNGGIGSAVVRRLRADGWHVVGTDRDPLAVDVDAFVQVDLADERAVAAAIDQLLDGQPYSGLVNNAAAQIVAGASATDVATWERVLRVNVTSVHRLTAALADSLAAGAGAIVNISSVHARHTTAEMAAYAASKGALSAYTRASALDLAPGVRVNAVLPGAVNTAMLRAGFARRSGGDAFLLEALARATPLGKIADPADIAEAVLFLLDGNRSGFITGQELVVDGGVTARLSSE